jgi:hypothetical protein
MPKSAQARQIEQHMKPSMPEWFAGEECEARLQGRFGVRPSVAHEKRPAVTVDLLQNKRIAGLQQELAEMRTLLNMVLTLVDPEDVRAAFEIRKITPSHDDLTAFAKQCGAPPELRDLEEEKPW